MQITMAQSPPNDSQDVESVVIPGSRRADGSLRKEIRVRAGYTAPEDVEVYKNKTANDWKRRAEGPAPGAQFVDSNATASSSSLMAAANKNAKRREARRKAATAAATTPSSVGETSEPIGLDAPAETSISAAETAEREARKLAKKLRQARELKDKKEQGGALLPEQLAKVIRIQELIRQLDALGFDAEGEEKAKDVGQGSAGETCAIVTSPRAENSSERLPG